VAHYIMLHYKEKEGIKKKKKKKYKPKSEQYQLEAGIKQFCEQGETVVTKELDQFNKYGVFEPKHANDLSEEDSKKALSLLIFLKEKKSGAINRNPQREHIMKEEAAAPTVGLNSVFITSTIESKEDRKVVTIHILGVFLHADDKDYVIMTMVGTLAELVVKNKPKVILTLCDTGKREISAFSKTIDSPIWHDEEHTVILQKTGIGTARDGI